MKATQPSLFSDEPSRSSLVVSENGGNGNTTSTFADNLALPVHRWFRYSAGFSALWAGEIIQREALAGRTHVLDPFVGSGTVLLEAEYRGSDAIGLEPHPFVARITRAKLMWRENREEFKRFALSVLAEAQQIATDAAVYPELIHRCFPLDVLQRLDALRRAWQRAADQSASSELTWLVLVSILRECSPAGTAQWQYVLPNRAKAKSLDPFDAFALKTIGFYKDMVIRQNMVGGPRALLLQEDARTCPSVPTNWADLIVTSPPYANNFDYADATRLEMSFFGEVNGWGDLQHIVRKHLIRSCTQHVAGNAPDALGLLSEPVLTSIAEELSSVVAALGIEREQHGGKKPYHAMIAAYFYDMAQVWVALRRVTRDGARVCFVIGDSAPYGIHVPVDKWLGELAVSAGFRSYTFEKTRDRNVKWKNRKHRVPLHEGRLWVEG